MSWLSSDGILGAAKDLFTGGPKAAPQARPIGTYQNYLSGASDTYSSIIKGYQDALNAQKAVQAQVQAGYGQLGQRVQQTIQGIGQSQQQALADTYAAQQGATTQGLTNSGLGNTTVASSLQRGNTLDYAKAQVALSNQLAQLQAGYQSQIGEAGLGYQAQSALQNTGQSNLSNAFQGGILGNYLNANLQTNLANLGAQSQNAGIQQQGQNQLFNTLTAGAMSLAGAYAMPNTALSNGLALQNNAAQLGMYGAGSPLPGSQWGGVNGAGYGSQFATGY